MTDAEPTAENEELSGTIRRLIDAYRMGAALDAKCLYAKKTEPEPQRLPRPVTQPA